MNKRVADIFAQAQQLSSEERAKLLDMLLALDEVPEYDPGWAKEIERRVAEFERGEATVYDAEEVLAELRAKCV